MFYLDINLFLLLSISGFCEVPFEIKLRVKNMKIKIVTEFKFAVVKILRDACGMLIFILFIVFPTCKCVAFLVF